jgi:hypothetical protein
VGAMAAARVIATAVETFEIAAGDLPLPRSVS